MSKNLALAERWAKESGKETDRAEAEGPTKTRVPIVHVKHGQISLFVRDGQKGIVVFGVIQIQDEVRSGLSQVPEQDRKQALIVLKSSLLQNPRTGFAIEPLDAQTIDHVRVISVEQTLHIADGDLASMNRFTDAIQELATAIVQANLVFGIAMGGSKQTYSSGSPPPPDIYRKIKDLPAQIRFLRLNSLSRWTTPYSGSCIR
jgi:hypothetical protein